MTFYEGIISDALVKSKKVVIASEGEAILSVCKYLKKLDCFKKL